MVTKSTLLAALAVVLVVVAIVAVVAGEPLFAGLCLLGTSFAIYLRETRA